MEFWIGVATGCTGACAGFALLVVWQRQGDPGGKEE